MAARKNRPDTRPREPGEEAFLEGYDPSVFARPSLTVDVVLFTVASGVLSTLVVQRGAFPFKGRWALPGGFVGIGEGLEAAAARVLRDKCGLDGVFLEQLATFGDPGRDPRTRVVTVAYYALVDARRFESARAKASAGTTDVASAKVVVPWEGEAGGAVSLVGEGGTRLALAFDHDVILGVAVKRIRGKLDYTPIGYQLLPARFTLLELQTVHETVLGRALNKDSFRRRMLATGELEPTGELEQGTHHRPAELYRFTHRSAV